MLRCVHSGRRSHKPAQHIASSVYPWIQNVTSPDPGTTRAANPFPRLTSLARVMRCFPRVVTHSATQRRKSFGQPPNCIIRHISIGESTLSARPPPLRRGVIAATQRAAGEQTDDLLAHAMKCVELDLNDYRARLQRSAHGVETSGRQEDRKHPDEARDVHASTIDTSFWCRPVVSCLLAGRPKPCMSLLRTRRDMESPSFGWSRLCADCCRSLKSHAPAAEWSLMPIRRGEPCGLIA